MKKIIDWLLGEEPDKKFGYELTDFQRALWESKIEPPQWAYLESTIEKKRSKFHRLPKGAYGK